MLAYTMCCAGYARTAAMLKNFCYWLQKQGLMRHTVLLTATKRCGAARVPAPTCGWVPAAVVSWPHQAYTVHLLQFLARRSGGGYSRHLGPLPAVQPPRGPKRQEPGELQAGAHRGLSLAAFASLLHV